MSDQSPITRRDALLAATALGAIATVAQAEQPTGAGSIISPDTNVPAFSGNVTQNSFTTFKVEVTLPDGQVVTFKARSAVVDFTSGRLQITSSGILPVAAAPFRDAPADQPIETKRKPTPDGEIFDAPQPRRKPTPAPKDDDSPTY